MIMETNEPTKDNELTAPVLTEATQDGELNDEELETVGGGLLPAVRNNVSTVNVNNLESHGIIAVLIGL